MLPLIYFLSITAIASGAAFVPMHILYWTQPGNCGPCSPELFDWSVAAGIVFMVANLLLVRFIASDFEPRTGSIASLRLAAWRSMKFTGLALFACLLLIGLVLLPVAVAWSVLLHVKALLRAVPMKESPD